MNNVNTEVSEEKGIIENILMIGNQPFQVYKKIIQILYQFEAVSMTEPGKEMDNETAEVNEKKGIIENILAMRNYPFQVPKKIIQILYHFGKLQMQNENKKAEDNEHKGMIANIFALPSLPIQLCKKTIQLLNPFENEKAENNGHKGMIANIFALPSLPIQLCKKTIQLLNPFDNEKAEVSEEKGIVANMLVFRHWHNHVYKKIFRTQDSFGDLQEKIQELQRRIDQLQKELEWSKARNNTDNIILDTNTAHPNLYVAEHRKSFSYEAEPQRVPPNSERFDSAVCVLGTEGFAHGKHYWEVDVGNISDWDLGVARKSIKRKGKISLSPKEGFWVLSVSGRDYWAKTDPWSRLTVQKKPKKIGVYLCYNGKQVTFFNVTDMSVLFTFNDCSFSEEVCPFFKNSHKKTTMRIASIKEEELI